MLPSADEEAEEDEHEADYRDEGADLGLAAEEELIRLVVDGRITKANAKEVFEAHVVDGRSVEEVIRERGFHQISDAVSIDAIVDEVIAANPKAVADYRAGKPVIGFFVGQVMKATRGQANAGLAEAAIRARLDGSGAGEG